MADAAGHFDRHNFKIRVAVEKWADYAKRVANRFHFRFAGAPDSDKKFFHRQWLRSALPEVCLFFKREPDHQKLLQLFDRSEHFIATAKHPAANLIEGQRRD